MQFAETSLYNIYIYIYIYYYFYLIYYIYMYIYIKSIYLYIYIYIYMFIVIVCDHEITHTSYAICRHKIYIKLYSPFLWMGCNCLNARQSHYEETVYFLSEIPVTHQINIGKMKG